MGIEHNFRIFPNLPNTKRFTERNRHPYSVYITMYLPTTVSDTSVRKAFDYWGVVHVFQGTYKKDFHEIKNGKWHVRVTPHDGDKSCFPQTIQFPARPGKPLDQYFFFFFFF